MELILVLVLIAVLTTLATPSLRGFTQRAALADTAASLLTLTQQAQTRATHQAVPYRVVIDTEERAAWLECVGDEGYETIEPSGAEPVRWESKVTLVTDLERTDGGLSAITCQPNGVTTPGGIVLEQDGRFVALQCIAATERYRIISVPDDSARNAEGVLDAMRL